MKAIDIQKAMARTIDLRVKLLVPNVSWGLVSWGECDLLAMSGSGYLTEYEIKVSAADIKREWRKKRWVSGGRRLAAFNTLIKEYYMVVPQKLEQVAIDNMPDFVGGGIIVADYQPPEYMRRHQNPGPRWVRNATINKDARKLNAEERFQLARLGTLRYWSKLLKEK